MARYKKRNILQLEQRIKDIYGNDRTDPELYVAIKDLAEAILILKGMAFNHYEADQISHNLASDLYMKIYTEGFHVWHWTKYIWLRLYDYRSRYLNETRSTEFIVDDIVDLDKMKYLAYPQAEATYNGYNYTELSDIVDNLPIRIREIFDKYVRYQVDSPEYNKVWCSVMLSIMKNNGFSSEHVIVFQLDNSYYNYIKFMINLISKRLAVYLHKICNEDLSRKTELSELISGYKSVVDN